MSTHSYTQISTHTRAHAHTHRFCLPRCAPVQVYVFTGAHHCSNENDHCSSVFIHIQQRAPATICGQACVCVGVGIHTPCTPGWKKRKWWTYNNQYSSTPYIHTTGDKIEFIAQTEILFDVISFFFSSAVQGYILIAIVRCTTLSWNTCINISFPTDDRLSESERQFIQVYIYYASLKPISVT